MERGTVHRRHVFFLSGFDPKGASYYHGLYRNESALQAAVTGARYDVGARQRRDNGNTMWQVRGEAEGQTTETTFEYVRWDDIVRAHWPRNGWQVLLGSLRGYCAALASPAALRKVWHASRKTLIALAYPAAFWLGALLLGALMGLALASLLAALWPAAAWLPGLAGTAAAIGLWWAALAWERRLNTSWLLRIYQFAGDWRAGRTPSLQTRIDNLVKALTHRLADRELDEVLLVGFSVGSLLAVSTAARLQKTASKDNLSLDRFSLVTLGHCVPLLGLMKGADAFRAELARLGQAPHVRWVDFSSLTDWGSFALVDPLALCLGPAGAQRPYAPRMASPRFHLMFEPETYARIIRDKRRMHLQYLMAGQRPAVYDYFAITAGPCSLPERLARMPAP
jgi:hypothetical protein